jgi:hypothetical protein
MDNLTITKIKKRKNSESYMCKVSWIETNPERTVTMIIHGTTPREVGDKCDSAIKQLKQQS